MQGTAVIVIARNACQSKSLMFKRARDEWLINNETLITGTMGATPIIGASAAESKKPPATPVAPWIVDVTNESKPISNIVVRSNCSRIPVNSLSSGKLGSPE